VGSTEIVFSAQQAAAALWTYGEDVLVEKALSLSETDLRTLWKIAGGHWKVEQQLPLKSRLVLDKVTAFACIEFLEGRLRPLRLERRRASKAMPSWLRNAAPFQGRAF